LTVKYAAVLQHEEPTIRHASGRTIQRWRTHLKGPKGHDPSKK